ncbi:MAG: macro domain-containing protein [Lachnospiraceae bacterium]|nr:macro domain-containing protein [Lachnospiraceae bacterium]
MPFQIIRNDITKVRADVIVNSANPMPTYGLGADKAIYKAAGEEKLLEERKKIGMIDCGDIAVTPAFGLKAGYIIHTVAPLWDGGNNGEFEALKSCYRKSLEKAYELGASSIAFPLLATGVYRFPKAEALRIAMDEISAFLMRDDVEMTVKLVVFDDNSFRLSKNLFFQVESFVSDEDVIEAHKEEYGFSDEAIEKERERARNACRAPRKPVSKSISAGKAFDEDSFDKEQYLSDDKEELSFLNHLRSLIIEKDIDNAMAYKNSNVTRGAFSKIMCGDTKKPQKKTVLAFCIGLKLSLEESILLLASADMAFQSI